MVGPAALYFDNAAAESKDGASAIGVEIRYRESIILPCIFAQAVLTDSPGLSGSPGEYKEVL